MVKTIVKMSSIDDNAPNYDEPSRGAKWCRVVGPGVR